MLRTIVGAVLAAACVQAQSSYGRVTGRITDPCGALVSGATIRAVQVATNIAATTSSNQDGVFELLNLLSGGAASYLMQLSPGVISLNAPSHGWLPQARDSIANLSVGGARTGQVSLRLEF
jgi:hypothetical protein